MISRKMYRQAARVIRDRVRWVNSFGDSEPLARSAVAKIARDLAEVFKDDNSQFRYDDFFELCGLDEWGKWK